MDLLPLFKKQNALSSLIESRERIVLAVSGGVDSMVLLDLLSRLKIPLQLSLVVAHLDHGVRGRESLRDARLVEKAAHRLKLPFEGKTLPKGFFKGKGNFQEAARTIRYEFLLKVAKKHKAAKIVTAHQADDQLETFLMRLIRGAGLEGLKGMGARRLLFEKNHSVELVRPLLFFNRDQIVGYARFRRLAWREDSSNLKEDYLRNRVRLRLVPELKNLNPRIVENVSQTLEILQKEDEWVEETLRKILGRHMTRKKQEIRIGEPWLKRQAEALRFRIYRRALQESGAGLQGIHRVHLEAVDQMLKSKNKKARVTFPRGFGAYVSEKQLIFKKWMKTPTLHKRGFFC